MKYLLQLLFGLFVLTFGNNVYAAISVRGDGFINFDGTGEFLIQRFPMVIEKFDSNCTPSTIPGITFLCHEPLEMSLLGNDIVRAEHVRIGASLRTRIDCETLFTYISGVTVIGESIAGTDSVAMVGCH